MIMFSYYGEKWYITFLKWLEMMFSALVVLIVFLLILMCFPQKIYHYEYIDLDNNPGIAVNCSYEFSGYRGGGQGSPVCELEDGTVKQVKEYKYIYDNTIVPIKEIFKDWEKQDYE